MLYMGGIGTDPSPIDAAAWYFLARRAGLTDPDMEDFLHGLTDEENKQAFARAKSAALEGLPSNAHSPAVLWSWEAETPSAQNSSGKSVKMAKINGNEIRPGNVIEHQGGLWVAVRTNTVKPGKGGAYNQVELKNLINGTKLNERFRSTEKVEQIRLEHKDFSFLYEQGDPLVFMDTGELRAARTAEGLRRRSRRLPAGRHDGHRRALRGEADRHLAARPGDAGHHRGRSGGEGPDRASSYKPAMLENGIRVLVPPFIASGERIVVDTNEITYAAD